MNNRIKTSSKLIMASILSTILVACGSGGGTDTGATNTTGLNGIVINNSNYESAFKTGVTGSFNLALNLMFSGDDIETDNLVLSSFTSTTRNYDCYNQGGTMQKTELGNNTTELVFDDCLITEFGSSSHHQGITTIKTVLNSGDGNNLDSYLHNWDITQTVTFNDYTETSPAVNGTSVRANGGMILESSNNLEDEVNRTAMRSTNLVLDSTDVSDVVTTYAFSDIYYDLQEDIVDDSLQSEFDFTANITGLGDVDMVTNPVLQFDDVGTLLSGSGFVTTGNSVGRMVATGNDNIEISLDPENDGTYESPILTTWSAIGGGE